MKFTISLFLVFTFSSCKKEKEGPTTQTFTFLEYGTNQPVRNAQVQTYYCTEDWTWSTLFTPCPAQEKFFTDSFGQVVLNPSQQYQFTVIKNGYFYSGASGYGKIKLPTVFYLDKIGLLHLHFTTNKSFSPNAKAYVDIQPENVEQKNCWPPPYGCYVRIGEFTPATIVSLDIPAFAYQRNQLRISFDSSPDTIQTVFNMTGLEFTADVNY